MYHSKFAVILLLSSAVPVTTNCSASNQQQTFFYSIVADTAIYKTDAGGGNRAEILRSGGGTAEDIAVDAKNQRLFWASPADGGILTSDFEGGSLSRIISFGEAAGNDMPALYANLVAFDAVNQNILWTAAGRSSELWKHDIARGESSMVIPEGTAESRIDALEVDSSGQFAYWIDRVPGLIRKTNIETGVTDTILDRYAFDFTLFPSSLALDEDAGLVYVSHEERDRGAIVKVGLDGTSPSVLLADQRIIYPTSLAFDGRAERLYWSNSIFDTRIYSVNRAGGAVTEEFDPAPARGDFVDHMAIAYIEVPEPATQVLLPLQIALAIAGLRFMP